MKIPFAFRRMFIEPGKTFAVTTVAGDRVRVVDGTVWATTSSNPEDVWLRAGDEHTVGRPGLTVVESVAGATVDLIPPAAPRSGTRAGRISAKLESAMVRAMCRLAAVAMAAATIGLLVVLPASVAAHDARARAPAAVTDVAASPSGLVENESAATLALRELRLVQASIGTAAAPAVR